MSNSYCIGAFRLRFLAQVKVPLWVFYSIFLFLSHAFRDKLKQTLHCRSISAYDSAVMVTITKSESTPGFCALRSFPFPHGSESLSTEEILLFTPSNGNC